MTDAELQFELKVINRKLDIILRRIGEVMPQIDEEEFMKTLTRKLQDSAVNLRMAVDASE